MKDAYGFRSKGAGDLLMTQAVGSELWRLIGREPSPRGILEVAAVPAALVAIEQAPLRRVRYRLPRLPVRLGCGPACGNGTLAAFVQHVPGLLIHFGCTSVIVP